MSLDNGGPLDRMLDEWRTAYAKMSPEQREATDRETAISFVLGNLNASTNHQTTRELVEAAYDSRKRLEQARKNTQAMVELLEQNEGVVDACDMADDLRELIP